MAKLPRRSVTTVADLRGSARLVIDSVSGVTRIVESMHHRIARVSPPLGQVTDEPTRGITGLVYRSIHGATGLVGLGLDAALAGLEAGLQPSPRDLSADQASGPTRNALVAALNGVLGDHLERTGNPLATKMQLRVRGALAGTPGVDAKSGTQPGSRLLLLLHGLCMNDEQWTRDGHDHGQTLARSLGYTPVYALYNSGRHVSANGRELATQLEQLLANWPVPVEMLTLVGHSMGGLVARSAVHYATVAGMAWPTRLRHMVFLGTPHHGAPLERGGNWLHRGLGISPYLAPFTRLSGLRSAGITDLRHGNLLDEDWADHRFAGRDTRTAVPLPAGVACYAIAATLGPLDGAQSDVGVSAAAYNAAAKLLGGPWLGDGLVPVSSALGRHARSARDLRIPASHLWIARGINHMDLLSSKTVYRRLRQWLGS